MDVLSSVLLLPVAEMLKTAFALTQDQTNEVAHALSGFMVRKRSTVSPTTKILLPELVKINVRRLDVERMQNALWFKVVEGLLYFSLF
jgi:hypothetical protein